MSTVTVNSTAGLLSALKAAHGGDTILLSAGTYSGADLSNFHFSNAVTIASANPAQPASLTQFTVSDSSGLKFKYLNLTTVGATTPDAFRVYGGNNIIFARDTISGDAQNAASVNGLLISGSSAVIVRNSTFDYDYSGILELSNNDLTISGNVFHNMYNDGVDNAGSSGVTLSDNQFYDFTTVPGDHPDAMQFWTSTATPVSNDITITGNVMTRGDGNAFQGIFIQSGPYDNQGGEAITHVTIADNTTAGLLYRAISLQGVGDATLNGNVITAYSGQESYIVIQSSNAIALTDNSSMLYSLSDNTDLTQVDDHIDSVQTAPALQGAASGGATASAGSSNTAGTMTSTTGGEGVGNPVNDLAGRFASAMSALAPPSGNSIQIAVGPATFSTAAALAAPVGTGRSLP